MEEGEPKAEPVNPAVGWILLGLLGAGIAAIFANPRKPPLEGEPDPGEENGPEEEEIEEDDEEDPEDDDFENEDDIDAEDDEEEKEPPPDDEGE